jgi:hypothetical protein
VDLKKGKDLIKRQPKQILGQLQKRPANKQQDDEEKFNHETRDDFISRIYSEKLRWLVLAALKVILTEVDRKTICINLLQSETNENEYR